MPKRKLVIDEKEGSVLMGVMKEGADPVIKTIEGTLENALEAIPKLVEEAEAKWATSLKNPAYKAPPEPKKEPKAPASKPAVAKATDELPLLSGTEPAPVKAEVKAQAQTLAPAEVKAGIALVETTVEEKAETQMETEHEKGDFMSPGPQPEAKTEPAPTAPAPQTPSPAPAATPATPASQWQYQLKDGRGPFDTVQEAMDTMGLDKATRPQHNRWDRLSTALKDTIRRVEKKL